MMSQNNCTVPDHCCPFLVTGFSAGGGSSSFGSCCNVFRDMSLFAVGYTSYINKKTLTYSILTWGAFEWPYSRI